MTKKTQAKTRPTDEDPRDFIAGVSNKVRREDGYTLLDMCRRITGEKAVMWGPSIVGFGERSYRLASGSEGSVPRIGFSPRSSSLVLYLPLSHPEVQSHLARLGPHSTGVSCLYLKKLGDIDLGVLEEILRASFASPDSG